MYLLSLSKTKNKLTKESINDKANGTKCLKNEKMLKSGYVWVMVVEVN